MKSLLNQNKVRKYGFLKNILVLNTRKKIDPVLNSSATKISTY